MTTDTDREMTKLSHELPAEVVRRLEEMLKKSFEIRGTPYNRETLLACISILEITIPTLPMMYAEFFQATLLILYRLIEEQDTGLISSPVKL